MKREENNDWIEAMRQSLREAELTPPEDGWARLQRELEQRSLASVPAQEPVAAKRPAWKIVWPRVAAAAAAVLVGVVAGSLLLRPNHVLVENGDVIASAGDSTMTAAPMPPQSAAKSLQTTLAEAVGLSEERSDAPSSSMRAQTLLAAATPADREAAQPHPASSATLGPERAAGTPEPQVGVASPTGKVLRDGPLSVNPAPVGERHPATAHAAKSARADHADAATRAAVERAATPSQRAAMPSQRTARSRGTADEPSADRRTRASRTSFSVHAGGGLSGGSAGSTALPGLQMSASNDLSLMVGTGDNMTYVQRFDAGDNTYRHHQPLSFGVSVSKAFPYGLSLESGAIYTLVRSDVQTRHASEDVSQKLHFIGIPLRLNWQFFERGRLSLYIGAGGMAEKCVSAKFGTTSVSEPGLQWSAMAAVGLQYRLGEVVGLYFEPEGSYYFTETRLRTVRTDSPLTLSLRLGVRLSF